MTEKKVLTLSSLPKDQVDKVLAVFENGLFSGWDVNGKGELELYAEINE